MAKKSIDYQYIYILLAMEVAMEASLIDYDYSQDFEEKEEETVEMLIDYFYK